MTFDVLHNGGAAITATTRQDSFTRKLSSVRADIDPEAREFNYSTQTYSSKPMSDLTGPGAVNSVVNPAAIILQNASTANTANCSLIEATCLENIPGMTASGHDNSVNLPPGDPRIVWSVESGPGNVAFLSTTQDPNGDQGPFVYVYGTTAGRVLLEASYKNPITGTLIPLAEYEALVTPLHTLKYRVQLVTDTNGKGTNFAPSRRCNKYRWRTSCFTKLAFSLSQTPTALIRIPAPFRPSTAPANRYRVSSPLVVAILLT